MRWPLKLKGFKEAYVMNQAPGAKDMLQNAPP